MLRIADVVDDVDGWDFDEDDEALPVSGAAWRMHGGNNGAVCVWCPDDPAFLIPVFNLAAALDRWSFRAMLWDGGCPQGSVWRYAFPNDAAPSYWIWYQDRLWECDAAGHVLEGGRVLGLVGVRSRPELEEWKNEE